MNQDSSISFPARMNPMERATCELLETTDLVEGLYLTFSKTILTALKNAYPDVHPSDLMDGIQHAVTTCGKIIQAEKFDDRSGNLKKSLENFLCVAARRKVISILRKKDNIIRGNEKLGSDFYPYLREMQDEKIPSRLYSGLYFALMEKFKSKLHRELVNITCSYCRFLCVGTYQKELEERLLNKFSHGDVVRALKEIKSEISRNLSHG